MNKKLWLPLMSIMMVTMLSFGFLSCGSDDDDPTSSTTYTLKWTTETYGIIDDVTLFEYTGNGDKIGNHRIDNIEKNRSYKFTASDKTEKVKVYFKLGSSPRWVQQVYYLKLGSNTDIVVTDNTIIGSKEP